jgi:hypothetical protein
MPTFEVRVVERSFRSTYIEVDANDWEEAESIASTMFHNGEVDFGDGHQTEEVEFEVEDEVNL